MTSKIHSLKLQAMAANVEALRTLLLDASSRTCEARDHLQKASGDGAIGALLDIDRMLDDAKSLHGALLALHRIRG